MIRARSIRGRSLLLLAAAMVIAVAGCSSSSSGLNPFASNPAGDNGNAGNGGNAGDNGNAGNGGGTSLTSGLAANLDKLTSYQFSWTAFGASSGTAESPGDSGCVATKGTVVNTPTKSYSVNAFGIYYIVIGDQGWVSYDGQTWNTTDASSLDLSSFLPTQDYSAWFDTNASQFTSAGQETKNGVQCIHYKGNDSLSQLYGALSGVQANFQADLWVAVDGNYPVSGIYGFSASANGQSGSFGYKFDITNVNDAGNKVEPPANVAS